VRAAQGCADRSGYTGYLAAASAEWADPATRVVADLARNAKIDTANAAAFAQAVASGGRDADVGNLSRFVRPRCAAARPH
jgi:hypothetical protein